MKIDSRLLLVAFFVSLAGSCPARARAKLFASQTRYRARVESSVSPLSTDRTRSSIASLDTAVPCSRISVAKTLFRGAALRIASDLTGGTPCESVKTRVTTTDQGPIDAFCEIIQNGGIRALWTGTPTRSVEGALVGAIFMLASTVTKAQVKAMGGPPTVAALAGGLVGGVAQAVVMTPAGMVFTSLNYNKGRRGHEHENAFSVTRSILNEKGMAGMYSGGGPMAIRQASNWASRAGFTEIARTTFGMAKWGVWGELGSGVFGKLRYSCVVSLLPPSQN